MDPDVHMGSPPKRRRIDLSAENATVYTSTINPLGTPVTRMTDLPFSSPTRFCAALPRPSESPNPSGSQESIQLPQSEEEDTLEEMCGPKAKDMAGLLGIEDISDSQWHEAEVVREKRIGSRSSGEGASSSARHISSSMPSPRPHLVVDLSDSPTQASIKTPRATSPHDSESEPIEWPTSPIRPPKRQQLVSDSDEDELEAGLSARKRLSPVKKRKILCSPSPEAEIATTAAASDLPAEGADEKNPVDDATGMVDIEFDVDDADWRAGAAAIPDPSDDGLLLNAPLSPNNGPTLDTGPSLNDLFAEDDDEPAPPQNGLRDEYVDLVNDDDDDYDWESFPMPDLDDLAIPGSTTTLDHPPTKAAARLSSPPKPPAAIHPIMLISEMPPDVQDFYLNHWRRGANKANPKRRVEDDDDDDMSGSEEGGFGVKMPTRAPPSRGRGRGGWGFRGRGRGRARGRGRGRGR